MKVSDVTKRNILDELKQNDIKWHGRLTEIEFLNRMFNLRELPSSDQRFKDMEGDVWQHRVNNFDWEDDWWVMTDSRLNLNSDDIFLQFLCEMTHPLVREKDSDVKYLVDLFNTHLEVDGWQIAKKKSISGRPVFTALLLDTNIDIENKNTISHEFVREQLNKCEQKVNEGDYDGAITNARSLLEGVFDDIYQRITGVAAENNSGKLLDKYSDIKKLLNLATDKDSKDAANVILRNLTSLIDGIDKLGNKMGDRHIRKVRPEKYHARLCVNSAKTLTDFFYSILDHQFKDKENLYEAIILELNSNKRFLGKDDLSKDDTISKLKNRHGGILNGIIKDRFINEYEIDCFRQSDIFFAAMEIYHDLLKREDIAKIFEKHKTNGQACGLLYYLRSVQKEAPFLLNDEVRKYLKENE